jgi:hypothetical protein
MFGFSKHCVICGIDVKKEEAVKRFGKYLCSEQHAEEFVAKVKEGEKQAEQRRREWRGRGGCC